MTEFINYAIKMNKIKTLDDLEWYYNDFNFNFIQESEVQYNNFIIGDLVLVQKYKYRNGSNRLLSYIPNCRYTLL